VAQNYSFVDLKVSEGPASYRIRIVDIDGKFDFTPISSVNINCNRASEVKLYPNPAAAITTLSITSPEELTYDVKMVDAVGRVVYSVSIDIKNETKLIEIPVEHLATGLYNILVTDRISESKVIRFQKVNQ
jgi:hypothetical protein